MEATHEQVLAMVQKVTATLDQVIDHHRAFVRERKGGNRQLMMEIDKYRQRYLRHLEVLKLPPEARPSRSFTELESELLELEGRLLNYTIWNAPDSLTYMCKRARAWFSKRFLPQTS